MSQSEINVRKKIFLFLNSTAVVRIAQTRFTDALSVYRTLVLQYFVAGPRTVPLHLNLYVREQRLCRCRSGRNTWATTGTLSFSRRFSSRFRSISRHSKKTFSTPSITTRTSKASLSRGWHILTTKRRKHRSSRKRRNRRNKMLSAQQICPYLLGDMIHLPKTDVRVHT